MNTPREIAAFQEESFYAEDFDGLFGTNTISHAYDTIGNHVFLAYNSATNIYANNALNQTVAQYSIVSHGGAEPRSGEGAGENESLLFTTNSLIWSAQGGLQRAGRFIYAFDAEDQLVSVTSATLTNGTIRVVNAYDYRHRRIAKTVYTMRDDSPPTSPLAPPSPIAYRTWCLKERHDFVYDDWNLIHETVTTVDANSATNVAEIEYFWGPDLSNTLQGSGGVGGLLAVSQNGQFYFPVYDNLGNIVKYLDESGNIVASYTYDDFGRMLSSSGVMSDIFVICFATKYFDNETNLYYYGCRFYSPSLKRWFNQDFLEERDSENLYLFCMNSALVFVDIKGMFSFPPCNKCRDDEKKMIRGAMANIHRKLGEYLEFPRSGSKSEIKQYRNKLPSLYSDVRKRFYYSPSDTKFKDKRGFRDVLGEIYKYRTKYAVKSRVFRLWSERL